MACRRVALIAFGFQHAAARRRLGWTIRHGAAVSVFQHAAARRRLGNRYLQFGIKPCFNTQPPEGGWVFGRTVVYNRRSFNTQPPEGGWWLDNFFLMRDFLFQHAAARRRLGRSRWRRWWANRVSTRSRPKAAGSCRL